MDLAGIIGGGSGGGPVASSANSSVSFATPGESSGGPLLLVGLIFAGLLLAALILKK